MHEVAATPAAGPSDLVGIGSAAGEALRSLSSVRARIADLVVEATELDERAAAIARAESEAAGVRQDLAAAAARNAAVAADLEARQKVLVDDLEQLRVRSEVVARREELVELAQQALVEQAQRLEERTARLHWRWLLRAWRWRPPLLGRSARVCELLFVPSPDGYRLLEQEGMALTSRARISGLLGEGSRYVVTKIAPWPLEDRWCAYLQHDLTVEGGAAEDDGDR